MIGAATREGCSVGRKQRRGQPRAFSNLSAPVSRPETPGMNVEVGGILDTYEVRVPHSDDYENQRETATNLVITVAVVLITIAASSGRLAQGYLAAGALVMLWGALTTAPTSLDRSGWMMDGVSLYCPCRPQGMCGPLREAAAQWMSS
jgi:hypothetical protein